MSRARNIKPGFFKNELLVELPFECRLLFIGLWTVADRAGRLEDRPTKIRMELFPADAVDVNSGLQSLHDAGFILRYEADGRRLIQVLAWDKHQNPHIKEAKSILPAPGEHGASTVQDTSKGSASPADSLIPDSLIPDSEHEPANAGLSSAAPEDDNDQPDDSGEQPDGRPPCPHVRIIALYHESLPELRQVREWNDTRRRLLARRWAESPERQTLAWWREFFGYVRRSRFLMGQTTGRDGRPFDCDLEWLIRPTNFAKVVEGKYEDAAA